jgi:hypothetical protein
VPTAPTTGAGAPEVAGAAETARPPEERPRQTPEDSPRRPLEERPRRPRPLIERLGLAAIALVLAALFGAVAYSAWIGGEPFLAVMGGIGCLMTAWVGGLTLIRG